MKVGVSSACQGHGRCLIFDLTVLEADDLGFVQVVGDGTVPDGEHEAVRLAAANCPERAIAVEEA